MFYLDKRFSVLVLVLLLGGLSVYLLAFDGLGIGKSDESDESVGNDLSTFLPSSEDLGKGWKVGENMKEISPKVFADSINSTENEILGWGFENGIYVGFKGNGRTLSILLLDFSSEKGAMELMKAIESFAEKGKDNLSEESLGDFSLSYICKSCPYISFVFKKDVFVGVLSLTENQGIPEKGEIKPFAETLENNMTVSD